MRSWFLVSLWALFTTVLGIEFINPGPEGPSGDYSLNAVYVKGSPVNIQWTPAPDGARTSLTMFQLKGKQFLQPFEYLTQSVLNVTSLSWMVQTTKDLSVSNTFFFCLFIEGEVRSTANSHAFNITENAAKPSSTSSSSRSSSSSSATSSTTSSTSTQAPASESTTTPPVVIQSSAPGGLSTGAKAGIGIGISAAVVLGLGAGWFIFGRRKKQDGIAPGASGMPSNIQAEKWQEQRQDQIYQLSGESTVAPLIHELPSERQ
ncbi:uncharacterized protein BP5553_09598 [Venustampulla echinocandica]|uniref:Mid2 domain-containing protein n=1 Tax=Venustampulla echinocandica TaxID=2656787 RepID=A0A370TBH1_9HELO|nr:uncharacterized protein BP5553_09598 [Venustampulla echinocandica]RDL31389.1 hypothetical protein BP5553_09598 [Venustampulla echinocandica]